MSCATTGRLEHGTLRTTPQDAPLLRQIDDEWANYYKNITEDDIRKAVHVDSLFHEYSFTVNHETHDLYFYGIKNGNYHKRRDFSWLLEDSPRNIKIAALRSELNSAQDDNIALRNELDTAQSTSSALRGELNTAETAIVALRDELDAAQTYNDALHNKINALLKSKSWKATHPLRVFMTHVKNFNLYASRFRNALRYIVRGNFAGFRLRIQTIKNEKKFEVLSSGSSSHIWCVMATPHTLFIANLIAARLRSHGRDVDIRTVAPDDFTHDMYIVLCPQMFKKLPPGEKRISFQLEQSVSSRWFNDDYYKILENSFAVLDYSLQNIDFLSRKGIIYPNIFYVPIGAMQNYMPIKKATYKKYDILFYGDSASSPRRQKMLSVIRKNFNLRECSEIFAEEMAEEIRSARLVVNIHYYENALLEMPRIQECLSLGVPVVSESSLDQGDYPEIIGAVNFFEQGDENSMLEMIASALSKDTDQEMINTAIDRGSERFNFMFDRALSALGLLPVENVLEGNLPLQHDATQFTLSMPETIQRRRVYEENKPIGYTLFDGLRARPGWIGCGLSYSALAKHALQNGLRRLTVIEDDVLLPDDFDLKMCSVHAYLDIQEQSGEAWDVFAGVVAVLHDNTELVKYEQFNGITFLTLNKMTSMVCNIYSERGIRLLASWDHTNRDDQKNTIDKHLESQPGLRVIVALPFLVGHREELHSTLWGFQNTTYASLIEASETALKTMLMSAKAAESVGARGHV
jgi:hypothetical protein